jgi:hypothetical protein
MRLTIGASTSPVPLIYIEKKKSCSSGIRMEILRKIEGTTSKYAVFRPSFEPGTSRILYKSDTIMDIDLLLSDFELGKN